MLWWRQHPPTLRMTENSSRSSLEAAQRVLTHQNFTFDALCFSSADQFDRPVDLSHSAAVVGMAKLDSASRNGHFLGVSVGKFKPNDNNSASNGGPKTPKTAKSLGACMSNLYRAIGILLENPQQRRPHDGQEVRVGRKRARLFPREAGKGVERGRQGSERKQRRIVESTSEEDEEEVLNLGQEKKVERTQQVENDADDRFAHSSKEQHVAPPTPPPVPPPSSLEPLKPTPQDAEQKKGQRTGGGSSGCYAQSQEF
jgi:hypothetical protein